MRQDQMAEVMEQVFAKCRQLRQAGQSEYAHDIDNAFRNFESVAEDLDLSREHVLLVYLKKHLDGITAYVVHETEAQREPIYGRIEDSIVYLTLLAGMLMERDMPGWANSDGHHPRKFREDVASLLGVDLDVRDRTGLEQAIERHKEPNDDT